MKKPSGCWKWSGGMLTIVSALLIAFFVWVIVDSEREMDKSRQEYTASQIEYEEAMKAYKADSLNLEKPEFQPRGHIGVNIGAAFLVVFILFLLIPFGIGLLMLLYYWLKYRKWRLTRGLVRTEGKRESHITLKAL